MKFWDVTESRPIKQKILKPVLLQSKTIHTKLLTVLEAVPEPCLQPFPAAPGATGDAGALALVPQAQGSIPAGHQAARALHSRGKAAWHEKIFFCLCLRITHTHPGDLSLVAASLCSSCRLWAELLLELCVALFTSLAGSRMHTGCCLTAESHILSKRSKRWQCEDLSAQKWGAQPWGGGGGRTEQGRQQGSGRVVPIPAAQHWLGMLQQWRSRAVLAPSAWPRWATSPSMSLWGRLSAGLSHLMLTAAIKLCRSVNTPHPHLWWCVLILYLHLPSQLCC